MFKRILPTAIAISAGILVLLGAFLPIPPLPTMRFIALQWAMILGAFAFMLAFLHLLRVHLVRLGRHGQGWGSSLLVIVSAVGTLVLVFLQGTEGRWGQLLLTQFIIPGESALLALTAFTLVLTGMRMLRIRPTSGSLLFILVVVVVLVGAIPLGFLPAAGVTSMLTGLANWTQRVPATAGMRGLVIGVALGTLLAGLRIVFGTVRPHSDD
ncbi:MAG: hypothetical protein JXB35_05270 [Anaerolineae bacterium]|nr:hypothetical protein [Anaerolineae bacterium]